MVSARRRDPAALFAAALVVAALLAAVTSAAPVAALVGIRGVYTGVGAIVTMVAVWSVGRSMPSGWSRSLEGAIILGATANAVAAIFQALEILPLAIPDSAAFGRSSGLVGNPVHLAALCAGGLAVAGRRASERPWWPTLVAVGALAAGLNLAGGRAGIASALVGTAFALRRAPWRRVALTLLAAGLGLVLSFAIVAEPANTGVQRAVRTSESGRPDAWRAAVDAVAERPTLGFGPGRFGALSTPRRSLEGRRAEIGLFLDAHNWLLEFASTTGLLGVALLLGWLALAAAPARGGLAIFAAVVGANGLLQPASIAVTPLALLALGGAHLQPRLAVPRTSRRLHVVTALASVAVSACFIAGDVNVTRIGQSPDGRLAFDRARALLPDSPDLLARGASVELASGTRSGAIRSLALARRAIDLEPDVVNYHLMAASAEVALGREAAARERYERALRADPWSVPALQGLARTSGSDLASVHRACARVRQLRPRALCPL